jgi:prepilin-type N-terminal cleavage/methylation domain-containing protein
MISNPRVAARLRSEAGMTLVELMTAMALLGIIMVGITSAFVSAIRAETDLGARFQAQENVRQALGIFRSDLHCASAVTPTSGATSSITLTIPSGCKVAAGSETWCTVSVSGGYDLYRIPGATCSTGTSGAVRQATKLTDLNVFTPDATTHAGAAVLPSVAVSLRVRTANRMYTAADTIYLRNGTRQ